MLANFTKNDILFMSFYLVLVRKYMAARKSASKAKRKVTNGKSAAKQTSTASKKLPNVKDPMSKSSVIKAITDYTNLSRKEITSVFDSLTQIIEKHVKSGGPGKFVMPGLLKIVVVKKAATPARKGKNPFTGEEMMFKAKPARKVVKIRPLRALKEMVA